MPTSITGADIALASVLPSQKYPQGRVQRGLTNWWPLDGRTVRFTLAGAGEARPLDIVGNIYGTGESTGAYGGPPFNQGNVVYNFDATVNSQFLQLSSDPLLGGGPPTSITVAAWVYLNSYASSDAAADPRLICFQTDFIVAVGTTGATMGQGVVSVGINGAASESHTTQTIPLSTWTHVAATYNGTTFQVYLNGVASTMNAGGDGDSGTLSSWGIGCRSNNERIMNGRMADVMLFRGTVLNANEVASLYASYFLPVEEMPALLLPATAAIALGGFFEPSVKLRAKAPAEFSSGPFRGTSPALSGTLATSAFFEPVKLKQPIVNVADITPAEPFKFSGDRWFDAVQKLKAPIERFGETVKSPAITTIYITSNMFDVVKLLKSPERFQEAFGVPFKPGQSLSAWFEQRRMLRSAEAFVPMIEPAILSPAAQFALVEWFARGKLLQSAGDASFNQIFVSPPLPSTKAIEWILRARRRHNR